MRRILGSCGTGQAAPDPHGTDHGRGRRVLRAPVGRYRIEDISTAAGVAAATAYNHFPTKHALLAAVYAPHTHTPLAPAERDIAERRPVVDALTDQVHALACLSWRHRALTAAFAAAALTTRSGSGRASDPADDADPRTRPRPPRCTG